MTTKKLVLQVVADVDDAREGLAEVGKSVKGLFKGAEGAGQGVIDGTLKAFDGLKGALGPVAAAATTVLEIASQAIDLAQFAGEREILQRSVSERQLAGLRAATRGLVDDTTLMRAAAQGMQGDFALTQAQMENVAQAAVTLHNRGFGPIPELVREMTEALRQGEADGLKKFGVSAGETGTKLEKLGRAHAAMAQLARSSDNKLADSSTELTKLLIRLKNAFDDVKQAAGQLVGAFAWVVNTTIDGIEYVDGLIAKVEGLAHELVGLSANANDSGRALNAYGQNVRTVEEQQRAAAAAVATFKDALQRLGNEAVRVGQVFVGLVTHSPLERMVMALNELPAKLHDPMFGIMPKWQRAQDAARQARAEEEKAWKAFSDSLGKVMDHRLALIQRNAEAEASAIARVTTLYERQAAALADRTDPSIEALLKRSALDNFDPVTGKIRRIRDEAMNANKALASLAASGRQALGSLGQAAGTSLQAIISGNTAAQASMAEVFRQFLDQFGTEMQIQALKYLAMGTVAAVTPGEQPMAAGYFTAAAIFEAAALAAGVAERAVGPSSSGSGGGGGSGHPAANENTTGRDSIQVGGRGQGGTYIFQIGYGFIGDERALVREIDRLMRNGALTGTTRPLTGARRK